MNRFALAIAAATGALIAAQPAFAETAVVVIRDLDLSTTEGMKELDRRLEGAAKKACGFNEARTGSRVASADDWACYKDARKQIEKRLALKSDKKVAGR